MKRLLGSRCIRRAAVLGMVTAIAALGCNFAAAGSKKQKNAKIVTESQLAAQSSDAVLRIQEGGTHDLRNRVIRCRSGQEVGIELLADSPVELTGAVVEGCRIGILVTGDGPAAVLNTTVRRVEVGVVLAGNGGSFTGNIVGEADYGVVVSGDDYALIGNTVRDNRADGFLVTGDRNLLEGNTVIRNGIGIHVASAAPMVARRRFLGFLRDRGVGNVIRANTALDNRLDLREFAEDCEDNLWTGNVFETAIPDCID
jgi:parallel beta-helix repeat protein